MDSIIVLKWPQIILNIVWYYDVFVAASKFKLFQITEEIVVILYSQ